MSGMLFGFPGGAQAEIFLATFARVAGLFITAPLLSGSWGSPVLKAAFALATTVAVVPASPVLPMTELSQFLLLIGSQALAGLLTGMMLRLAFSSLPLAGEFLLPVSGFEAAGFSAIPGADSGLTGQNKALIAVFEAAALWTFLSSKTLVAVFMHSFSASMATFNPLNLASADAGFSRLFISAGSALFAGTLALSAPFFAIMMVYWLFASMASRVASLPGMTAGSYPVSALLFLVLAAIIFPRALDAFAALFARGMELVVLSGQGGLAVSLAHLPGQVCT